MAFYATNTAVPMPGRITNENVLGAVRSLRLNIQNRFVVGKIATKHI
jgi:hypothetical protein